jgi:hypothetical protein
MQGLKTSTKYARPTLYELSDRLLWQGRRYEVVDVARLTEDHEQVVLKSLDRRRGLPLSVAATDLVGATRF